MDLGDKGWWGEILTGLVWLRIETRGALVSAVMNLRFP
jgi:hypothetical protein